ncbi:DUF4124 domain-containing protein [uncultured Aquimonas sp.]|uniref:DUF4124 domain-containing protein n=1 Tax=uncultured Aquimonas sp. TaxID=385483 RepID=UPI00086F6BDD|nr:DUF4124 domain-containing protein [uncultured Aquimonas sp.]ODU42498.1 MAG: hypothetical protein ABS96_27310 [Xanthomonadaceae bacterium SCN 69-123]
MTKARWWCLALALGFGPEVSAAVYKCKTSEGEVIYQQVPCASGQDEEQVRILRGPSRVQIAEAQARLRMAEVEKAAKERADLEQALDNALMAESAQRGSPEADAYADQSNTPHQGPCPPGKVPLNASSMDPSQGWSSGKGYVPLRCGNPNAWRDDPPPPPPPQRSGPQRFQDQHGNWYSQPPGSGFARDERTGRQCQMSGKVIVRCD